MKLEQIAGLVKLAEQYGAVSKEDAYALLSQAGVDPLGLYQELEMSSRYVNTHRDISQPSDQVQLHSHVFYEVLFVRSGTGVQYLVGTERYLLQRGDVIIVPPGVGHRPLLTESLPEPYRRDVVWLSQEFVDGIIHLFPQSGIPSEPHTLLRTAGTEWETLLRDRFRAGVTEAENKQIGWESMVVGNTIQLMILLSRAFLDRGGGPQYVEKPELLEEVLAYVERHLHEKITLSTVSQRFFVSESKISQTFREQMGVSFHRCVNQRRLIAAKNLIVKGIALERVGEQVGFPEYSTFYRVFRQEYGISPRQYKKMQSE